MRRLGRRRWSMPVEARGEARCCNPADWSHRAMTASLPASLPPLPPAPAWSYKAVVAAAAAALLCCIWPPMWRCDRLWGANFQDLSNNRFTRKNPPSNFKKQKSQHNFKSRTENSFKDSDLKLHYQNKNKNKKQSRNKEVLTRRGKFEFKVEHEKWLLENVTQIQGICNSMKPDFQLGALKLVQN